MAKAKLLAPFITILQNDNQPAFMLNKQFDVSKFAQSLFHQIEEKRSAVTALAKSDASAIAFANNLKYSSVKHESRINTLYRLIGLPSDDNVKDGDIGLVDAEGKSILSKKDLRKYLASREFEQLQITFQTFLQANTQEDLNTQLASSQKQLLQLIAQLFDPNPTTVTRLFPAIQFAAVKTLVEPKFRIAPIFATTDERYINETPLTSPFLESVIIIRLLPQSGQSGAGTTGTNINTQGAVEDIIIQSLAFSLAELAKQYHRNQAEAEDHLKNGIALIREKPPGVSSSEVKAANINAGTRQNDGITTESDIRSKYSLDQVNLYSAIISLLPLQNDIIPTGIDIDGDPLQTRNLKDNALTSAFLDIVTANAAALQRSIDESKKVVKKRQVLQDKLTAELGSLIGEIGGISMAEILIVISALFIMDEEDLVGLIPKSRFDQVIANADQTQTQSSQINDDGSPGTPNKLINIFEVLKEFDTDSETPRTDTNTALVVLQDIIEEIYLAFAVELSKAHKVKE